MGRRLSPAARNILLLGGLLALALVVSPFFGSVRVPPQDVIAIVLHHLSGGTLLPNECPVSMTFEGHTVPCSSADTIVWAALLPQVLLATLVGAGLALAGGTMQGVFRNPLGDPYLLGISSGAALGAAVSLTGHDWWAYQDLTLPLFAFLGAMGIALLILLASRSAWATSETLLLTGVALGAFVAALLELIIIWNPQSNLVLTFWILGGFAETTWQIVGVVLVGVALGGILLTLQSRDLNILQLGDEAAEGLGVEVAKVRRRLLLLASLVTAVCVAFSGIIGFVGLVSPHVVRRLQGPNYRALLPISALFGGLFLVTAFDLSQTVAGAIAGVGTILPVGIITSFVGGPFFLWILYRRRRFST